MNTAGLEFLKSQVTNTASKRSSWSIKNKNFALAVFNKDSRCYRFLKNYLNFPSKSI